jgi:hypothetical protein
MGMRKAQPLCVATCVALVFAPLPAGAQELEPRAYSPAPVGMNFVTLGLSQSSGGVAVDPTLPLDNVETKFQTATVGYQRTFALAGRTASAGVVVPYGWGDASGDVFEEYRSIRRSGLADARLRMAVNLYGGPAGDPQQFAARTRSTQVGASVTVVAPTGEYDSNQLINLGSNRWSVKPEIGLYQPWGPWSFELAAGVWIFGDNDEFFGGQRREQNPVTAVQTHVGYTFRPRLWVAADYTYYWGGSTRLDGVAKRDRQESSRAGLVASFPLTKVYSLKLGWSNGVTARIGADFTTYSVLVQRVW